MAETEVKSINGRTLADVTARAKIEEIKNAAPGLVFDTVADMEAYIAENADTLKAGQDLFIREADVPDYWWDGAAAVPVETELGEVKEQLSELSEAIAELGGDTLFIGKTASFYGDSLTEVNGHYTKGYYRWVQEILGLSSYNNYGVGGYKVSDVINKVASVTDSANIIFVMIGVNDVQFNVPLGTFEGMESGTVYGNLNTLCQNLREKYPLGLLVFITPAEQTRYPSTTGVSMYDVAKAVREVCFKNSVVCYDNYTISGIYPVNLDYWTTDKCHWNDKAHEMVGKNLSRFVADTFRYLPESSGAEKTLDSITAVFNQGSVVIYDTDSLNTLKQYLTVTANYSDGTSMVVTGYTLSGTLSEGTSTITATYGGKSATFTVSVTKSESGGGDEPSDEPDESLLYSLPEPKIFNGTSDYIDTGVPLLAEAQDFTICIDSDFSTNNNNDDCVFCCMQTWGAYPGVMLGFASNGKYRLAQQSASFNMLPTGRNKMVITGINGGISKVQYTENSTVEQYELNATYQKFDGNLHIGAGVKQDGSYSFLWSGTVYDFKIYSGVMSDDEITAYLNS